MSPAAEIIVVLSLTALSIARQFFWFVFKMFIGIGIGLGFLMNLGPFPIELVGNWQAQLQSLRLDVPAGEYLAWVADNWLEITALIVLIVTVRARRILRRVNQTSWHAAFAASAITNYLEIEPMTVRLLRSQRKGEEGLRGFGTIWKEQWTQLIFGIFAGVPFLPDDAIPARNGEAARYRSDVKTYLEIETDDSRKVVGR